MEKYLTGFIFGCLLTVASTRLVYTKSDGRYPAYITNDLRVRCTENGFFPHPANCTWFYRCVDRSGFDFFHVFFFQCEPGTVFHDGIDQCVFGTETDPLCALEVDGPSSPATTTPATNSSTTKTPKNETTTVECKDCVIIKICKTGEKISNETICEACKVGNGNFSTPQEDCTYHPDPHLTSQGKCISGDEFCPVQREDLQEKHQDTLTLQCSDLKTRPDDPEIRSLYCHSYNYCSTFGVYLGTKTLCSNFFQCYKTLNGGWSTELRNCIVPNLYNFDLDQCVPEPKATELCSRY